MNSRRAALGIPAAAALLSLAAGLPAVTFTVTTLSDSGPGSLRQAIIDANSSNGSDAIVFTAAGTILVQSELPALEDSTGGTTLDGANQIVLDGSALDGIGNGLLLLSASNTVLNLTVSNFPQAGIAIIGGPDNAILGCRIGTDSGGQEPAPNGVGVSLAGGTFGSTVGSGLPGEGNVISGNTGAGVRIEGADTEGNIVSGNRIGTNAEGTAALPNGEQGIIIGGQASFNQVGGFSPEEGNVISGNTLDGVLISGAGTQGNGLFANRIGTDPGGAAAIPNGGSGLRILGEAAGSIVGDVDGGQNVISGNALAGVHISGPVTHSHQFFANLIGTDVTGSAALPNGRQGVLIDGGAVGNVLGSSLLDFGNVISGNTLAGVELEGQGTNSNSVYGGRIGCDLSGFLSIPNALGILVRDGADFNFLGAPGGELGNVISGNAGPGIEIRAAAGSSISGNRIGANIAGTGTINNAGPGVWLHTAAAGHLIGPDNLISGNTGDGILIEGAGSDNNQVYGSLIGPDVNGQLNIGNQFAGIRITGGARGSFIGDGAFFQPNVIAGNGGPGVVIDGAGAYQHSIRGSRIFNNGGPAIELLGGANQGILPPVIGTVDAPTGTVAGTAEAFATVDIFADDASDAEIHLGTAFTDFTGAFSAAVSLEPHAGLNVLALQTNQGGNTSQLSGTTGVGGVRTRVTLIENDPVNAAAEAGESLVFQFTFPVRVSAETVQARDFFLTQGSLGTDSTIAPSTVADNEAIITLGSTATGIVPGATQIDIGANVRPGLIVNAITGEQIPDSGEPGVDDTALPIATALGARTTRINLAIGGVATIDADPTRFRFTRHALTLLPGSLGGESIDVTLRPAPPAVTEALGFPTATQITTDRGGNVQFLRPTTLTLQYDPATLLDTLGNPHVRFGIAQVVEVAPGTFVPVLFPPSQTVFNPITQTISVRINSLDPLGGTLFRPRGAGGDLVGVFVTLPVNPVEERSIFIAPSGTGAAIGPHGPTAATLSPGANSSYPNHLITFPGWEITDASNPSRVRVTMRTPTLFERVSASGGQSFPSQSGAIFTLEAENAAGSPIAFPDPVDVTVQFVDRASPAETDLVRFDSSVDVAQRMRVARDAAAGSSINFQFAGGTQSASVAAGTVTLTGLANVTGADGVAILGAVADPAVAIPAELTLDVFPSVEELRLGEEITLFASVTNAGSVDAADTVLTVALPAELTVTGATSSQGTPSTAGSTVTLNLGTLGAGLPVSMQVTGRLDALPGASPIVSQASAAASNLDPGGLGDDSASVMTEILFPPDIDVSVVPLDFGSLNAGAGPGNAMALSVGNTGQGTLLITGMAFGGSNPSQFQATDPASGTLSVLGGGSDQLEISFNPTGSGPRAGTLTLESNDPDEPSILFVLSGEAIPRGSTGALTEEIVARLLDPASAPGSPEAVFDVNSDARIDSADAARNVNEVNEN